MPEMPSEQGRRAGRLARSFGYAFRGLGHMLRTQANARIHAGTTVVVLALSVWLGLSRLEWCVIVAAIGLVWTAEALNTVFESLVDLISPGHDSRAGQVKDVAAGAVLCASVTAAILGAVIFLPKLLARLAEG